MEDMTSNDVSSRRRGRPNGKNRIPLSLDERRARNAQYERERRLETSEAMSQLAAAAGCEPGMNNTEILATVINQLQRAAEQSPADDIQELKRYNEKLMQLIGDIEQRLSNLEDTQAPEENNNRKRRSKKEAKPSKRTKTESENVLNVPFENLPDNRL